MEWACEYCLRLHLTVSWVPEFPSYTRDPIIGCGSLESTDNWKKHPLPGQDVLIPAHMVSRETLLMSLKKECHQGAKTGKRKASSS